jgi:hypothetical protein
MGKAKRPGRRTHDRRLDGCLLVAPDHALAPRTGLATLFGEIALTPRARLAPHDRHRRVVYEKAKFMST